jgi:hypothetical protein
MREVRPGDVVLHFINTQHFGGTSRVVAGPDETFVGLAGTAWAGRPAIRYELADYTELRPPIQRDRPFVDERGRDRLLEILASHRGLFFNRNLELNQGAYLTEAPRVLVKLLNDIYQEQAGTNLPHVELDTIVPTPDTPRDPTARALTLEWLEAQTLPGRRICNRFFVKDAALVEFLPPGEPAKAPLAIGAVRVAHLGWSADPALQPEAAATAFTTAFAEWYATSREPTPIH